MIFITHTSVVKKMNQKAEWATSKVYIAIRWKASIPFVLQIFHLLDISEGCNGRTCSRYLTGAAGKKHVCRRQTKSFTASPHGPRPLPTQKMHLESLRLNTFKYIQITSVVTNDAQCEPQSQSIVTMIGMHFVVYLSTFPTLAQETSKYAKCANMDQWLQVQNMRSHPLPYAQLRAFSQRLLLLPLRPGCAAALEMRQRSWQGQQLDVICPLTSETIIYKHFIHLLTTYNSLL